TTFSRELQHFLAQALCRYLAVLLFDFYPNRFAPQVFRGPQRRAAAHVCVKDSLMFGKQLEAPFHKCFRLLGWVIVLHARFALPVCPNPQMKEYSAPAKAISPRQFAIRLADVRILSSDLDP